MDKERPRAGGDTDSGTMPIDLAARRAASKNRPAPEDGWIINKDRVRAYVEARGPIDFPMAEVIPLDLRKSLTELAEKSIKDIELAPLPNLVEIVEEFKIDALNLVTQNHTLTLDAGVPGTASAVTQTLAEIRQGPLHSLAGNAIEEMQQKSRPFYIGIARTAILRLLHALSEDLEKAKAKTEPTI